MTKLGTKPAEGQTQKSLQVLVDEYLASLTKIPGILHRGLAIREARAHDMPVDYAEVERVICQALQLRVFFLGWFENYSALGLAPSEVPSRRPDSIFETVLQYKTVWVGSLHMNYYATMLILQEVLNYCRYQVNFYASNQELADNILRSIETVATGTMGPLRAGYPLRIAYEVADTPKRLWIKSVLERFQKYYAATDPDEYPELPSVENSAP